MISKKLALIFLTLAGLICVSLILDPVQAWVEHAGYSPWLLAGVGFIGILALLKYGVKVL